MPCDGVLNLANIQKNRLNNLFFFKNCSFEHEKKSELGVCISLILILILIVYKKNNKKTKHCVLFKFTADTEVQFVKDEMAKRKEIQNPLFDIIPDNLQFPHSKEVEVLKKENHNEGSLDTTENASLKIREEGEKEENIKCKWVQDNVCVTTKDDLSFLIQTASGDEDEDETNDRKEIENPLFDMIPDEQKISSSNKMEGSTGIKRPSKAVKEIENPLFEFMTTKYRPEPRRKKDTTK